MSVSISHSAIARDTAVEGYETMTRSQLGMFRRRSLQPSRRAVLHVQAAGDPAVPSDVADWFTERAFHFYLAGLRVPHRLTARPGARSLASACADLDAACARLRQADGISSVIVAAQGRGALAAAFWSDGWSGSEDRSATAGAAGGDGRAWGDGRAGGNRADALVLYQPELPAWPALKLRISCPVLVVTGLVQGGGGRVLRGAAASSWPLPSPRRASAAAQLGSHVTWLHLPRAAGQPGLAEGAGRQLFFDELGRWLGAYMYGQVRDQLL